MHTMVFRWHFHFHWHLTQILEKERERVTTMNCRQTKVPITTTGTGLTDPLVRRRWWTGRSRAAGHLILADSDQHSVKESEFSDHRLPSKRIQLFRLAINHELTTWSPNCKLSTHWLAGWVSEHDNRQLTAATSAKRESRACSIWGVRLAGRAEPPNLQPLR